MNRAIVTLRAAAGRRAYAAIGVMAVVSAAGLAAPSAAQAAPAPPAQLSIALTDNLTEVHSNTDVSYTAKVTNNGTSPVSAELVLSTPAYVTVRRAAGAKVAANGATWRITVRPGHSVAKSATAHIGQIAKGEFRVTTLASLYRGKTAGGIPLIRTAVANTIAGVTDPARTVKGAPSPAAGKRDSSGTDWLLVAGGPALALVLLVAGTLLWRRWRRSGVSAASPADSHVDAPAVEPVAEPVAELVGAPAAAHAASHATTQAAPDVAPKRPRPAPVATGRHHAGEPG